MQTVLLRNGGPSAGHPHLGSSVASRHALGSSLAALSGFSRFSCQPLRTASRRRQGLTATVQAAFDLNFNPLDYLKVPREQVAMTLYPWMEAHARSERMRRWLQSELCMTEAQARSVLTRCPSLGDLDVRLAQRRLRQLDRDMHISRGEAALLVLRHPQQLLVHPADVVDFAVSHRGRRAAPPS
ncbi:hypothetical protein ABPG77_000046 [Micractinium sp. CCAP 211/92]